MLLKSIRLSNVRNLATTRLWLHPKVNVFVGPNGSGKTSILEVVYFLATGRSFRTSKSNSVINYQQQFLAINADCSNNLLNTNAKISILKHTQQDKVNKIGANMATTAQIAALIPTQIVNDGISNLIFKEPEGRRKFLDWLVFYAKDNYHAIWKSFNKVLHQRNKLLKEYKPDLKILDQLDKIFFDLSSRVAQAREEVWTAFWPVWTQTMIELELEQEIYPTADLIKGWKGNLFEQLSSNRCGDLKLGSTNCGPHKADLCLLIKHKPAKEVLSRGQGKLLSLSLIIARAKFITQISEREDFVSILLIDDLRSELDDKNAAKIIQSMLGLTEHVQLFVTAINKDPLLRMVPGNVCHWFSIEDGIISQEKQCFPYETAESG